LQRIELRTFHTARRAHTSAYRARPGCSPDKRDSVAHVANISECLGSELELEPYAMSHYSRGVAGRVTYWLCAVPCVSNTVVPCHPRPVKVALRLCTCMPGSAAPECRQRAGWVSAQRDSVCPFLNAAVLRGTERVAGTEVYRRPRV